MTLDRSSADKVGLADGARRVLQKSDSAMTGSHLFIGQQATTCGPMLPTQKLRDLDIILELLLEGADVLDQSVELLGRLLERREVGRGSVSTGQRVELDGRLRSAVR